MTWQDVKYFLDRWQETRPEECRCKSHFDEKGLELSDFEVCERERRWRQYTRKRNEFLSERDAANKKVDVPSLLEPFEVH